MKKDVFWFDIPMDDITIMHELDCMTHLLDYASHSLFRKTPFSAKSIVNVASTAKLKYKVKIVLIVKKSV